VKGKTPGTPEETAALVEAMDDIVTRRRELTQALTDLGEPVTPGMVRAQREIQEGLNALPQLSPGQLQAAESLAEAGPAIVKKAERFGRRVLTNRQSPGEISRFLDTQPPIVRDVARVNALDEIDRAIGAGVDPLSILNVSGDAAAGRLRVLLGDEAFSTLQRAAREGAENVQQVQATVLSAGGLDDRAAAQLLNEAGRGPIRRAVELAKTQLAFGVVRTVFRAGLEGAAQAAETFGGGQAVRVQQVLRDVLTDPAGAVRLGGLLTPPSPSQLQQLGPEFLRRLAPTAGGLIGAQ